MALVPQNLGVPTGTIMWSAAPDVPVGWLLCDGREVAKADYPVLAEFLGDTFGSTDSISFGLPNLVGRFIRSVGEAGRDPFTYQDGMNVSHAHGMHPDQTHTHSVTDPGHLHDLQGGDHNHSMTSLHAHNSTSTHTHTSESLPTHGYVPNTVTCNREGYVNPDGPLGKQCGQSPEDVMVTQKLPDSGDPARTGKTGITGVNAAFTGITYNTAETGVTMLTNTTGVTTNPALTNISILDAGEDGGPVPPNLALLPIIRT